MDKLVDYIKWMGELDFKQYPFRHADALVLCVISYFDLGPIFGLEAELGERNIRSPKGSSAKLKDCVPLIEDGEMDIMITGGDMGNAELLEAAARSRRFGELSIRNYVDVIDKAKDLQFAALCFSNGEDRDGSDPSQAFNFIAFRGTDSTLVGWKEDFMISFTKPKAQLASAEYAKALIQEDLDRGCTGRNWYIAGHSKGGNLALYSACMLPDELWDKVELVYDLDGPGFCPEVLDIELMKRIDPRTIRIIPEFEVIGKIFEPKMSNTHIVKSYRKGVDQHSLPSWLVEYGRLAEVPETDTISDWLGGNLDQWIRAIPHQQRGPFIDEFFAALASGGAESFDHLKAEQIKDAMVALSKSSDITKHALSSFPQRIFSGENLGELGSEIRDDIVQGIKTGAEKIKLPEPLTDLIEKSREPLNELIEKGKEATSDLIEKSKEATSDLIEKSRMATGSLRSRGKESSAEQAEASKEDARKDSAQ